MLYNLSERPENGFFVTVKAIYFALRRITSNTDVLTLDFVGKFKSLVCGICLAALFLLYQSE